MPTSSFSMAPLQGIDSIHPDNSTTVFDNTPPDTPERSTEDNSGDSPSHSSFRSDRGENIEVEVLTDPAASSTGISVINQGSVFKSPRCLTRRFVLEQI